VASCRSDDWFCAPIYDPAVKVILIQASGSNDAAVRIPIPLQLFSMIWLIGFVPLGVIWLITRHQGVHAPGWRKMTWVMTGWIVLSAIVIVVAVVGVPTTRDRSPASWDPSPASCPADDYFCVPSDAAGGGMSAADYCMVGLIGFVVLGLIWLSTYGIQRRCPTCGEEVRHEQRACGNCGQKFVPAVLPQTASNGGS
jgi:hypothetical protein